MADPLSIGSGIISILSLGIQVTESLSKFYSSYKNQDAAVAQTTERLEILLDVLRFLDTAIQNRRFQNDEKHLIERVNSTIRGCESLILEFQEVLQKFETAESSGIMGRMAVIPRRLAYPFRRSTLEKLDEDVVEMRHHLSLALDVVQLREHTKTGNDIEELRSLLQLLRTAQFSSEIVRWLQAPDVSTNHNVACLKRHPRTGTWFINGPTFRNWLTEEKSFLWLNGFAGCGKSVLCSTIIQHTFRHIRREPQELKGLAFFYFTFNDDSKRNQRAMLRALLLQLACQLPDGPSLLKSLYESYNNAPPPPFVLVDHLRFIIPKFRQVYIIMDALDESPRYGERDIVMKTIQTMRNWPFPHLHLLVTSRDEVDIRESLKSQPHEEVIMKNDGIDEDICQFISGQLNGDSKLRKWHKHHDLIRETLAKRAKGVFRWVECQFDSIKRQPQSLHHLKACLQSLPRSLDETYERILCCLDPESVDEARKILTLLCFSCRPLTVNEVIDGIAVDHDGNCMGLNPDKRLECPEDLLMICPGLIEISVVENFDDPDDLSWFKYAGYFRHYSFSRTLRDTEELEDSDDVDEYDVDECSEFGDVKGSGSEMVVRIAHFSVQEYLESSRIEHQRGAKFALSKGPSHAFISETCCAYLVGFALSCGSLTLEKVQEFPLGRYAAEFWYEHYCKATDARPRIDVPLLTIFTHPQVFTTWVRLHDIGHSWRKSRYPTIEDLSPIYFASLLGLDWVLRRLLLDNNLGHRKGDSVNTRVKPRFGTALQAASFGGYDEVVRILLKAGADANARGGECGDSLQAASLGGHEEVVRLLLDAGAKVNLPSETPPKGAGQLVFYGEKFELHENSLQAASTNGHEKVVRMLLNAGADANAQGGSYGNALQAASFRGHEKVVQMLLDSGADVNFRCQDWSEEELSYVGAPYHMISDWRDSAFAQGYSASPLQAALRKGHRNVVRILLAAGAETTFTLDLVSISGDETAVQILLDEGVNFDTQGTFYGSALQNASLGGREGVVRLLLNAGVDVDAQGGEHGSAICAAMMRDHECVVQMLVDAGTNLRIGHSSSTLQIASSRGYSELVQVLLAAGADVNAQGPLGNALQAASYKGHYETVHILLERGADVNASTPLFVSALQAASFESQSASDIGYIQYWHTLPTGETGQARIDFSRISHERVVKILLDVGVDVNAQDERHGSALWETVCGGGERIAQILLDAGAEISGSMLEHMLKAEDRPNVQKDTRAWAGYGHRIQNEDSRRERVRKMLVNAGAESSGRPLQVASCEGDVEKVQELLNAGADVNARGGFFGNSLQAASFGGHEEVVQVLLNEGASPNDPGGEYGSALQAASFEGHEEVVRILLTRGANVNISSGRYGQPLQAASFRNHKNVVQILLDTGAAIGAYGGIYRNALAVASRQGNQEVVRMLLLAGAEVNGPESSERSTALQQASLGGQKTVVRMLLEAGAHLNPQSEDVHSPLELASYQGNLEVVETLLDAGAEVNTRVRGFGHALQSNPRVHHRDILQMLRDAGTDMNAASGAQNKAIYHALNTRQGETVKMILDTKAEMEVQLGRLEASIRAATAKEYRQIAKLLNSRV